jgi:hypothetical protein
MGSGRLPGMGEPRPTQVPGLGPCLTLTQAAEVLGVSRQAVHQAIQRERLAGETREVAPGVRLLWIPLASVRAYQRDREAPRRPPTRGKRPGR